MHPQITNKSAITLDVHCFSFESAGALEFDNEAALEISCFYCKQLLPSGINVCQLERPDIRMQSCHACQ
jgi:hypothetical protein